MKSSQSQGESGKSFRIVHPVAGVLVGLVASVAIVGCGALVFGPVSEQHALALAGVHAAAAGRSARAAAAVSVAQVAPVQAAALVVR